MVKRYCLALDLKDDMRLIREYVEHHQNVWPDILESIKESGIVDLQIYLVSNRLFMILEADETFSFERKKQLDALNPKVQEWENLMWKYQESLPSAQPGEKWQLMKKIFQL
ncbi:MAG: L-rhamnose mutarotase [Allomuricauda sp.]